MEAVNDFHQRAIKKANLHTAKRDPTREHLVTRRRSTRPFWGIHRSLQRAFYPNYVAVDYGGTSSKHRGNAVENDLIHWIKNDYKWWHLDATGSSSSSSSKKKKKDFATAFLESHPPDPWAMKVAQYCERENIILLHAQTPIYDTACNMFTCIDFIGIHGVDLLTGETDSDGKKGLRREWRTCLIELKTGYDTRYDYGTGLLEGGPFKNGSAEYKDSPHNLHQLQLGFTRFLCENKYAMSFDEAFVLVVNDNNTEDGSDGIQRYDEEQWFRDREHQIYTELCLKCTSSSVPSSSSSSSRSSTKKRKGSTDASKGEKRTKT